ncbi:GNAT family N-acetyltransferase [Pseudomonas guariconensis]
MSAKGTPAWDVARIDRTFAETFVLRSELLVASCSDGIVGCCTLSAEDPEFWPDALKGEAAYLHKLAVRRTHAGRGVSSALIEACRHAARTQGCAKLRLDCHPNLRGLYERLGFTHVDTFNPGWDPTFIAERLDVMSRDVVESVEGYAANRRVVSVVVVEVEPAGQRQASFGL